MSVTMSAPEERRTTLSRVTLLAPDGTALAPGGTLAAAGLADGAELHFLQDPFAPGVRPDDGRAADVAAPPEVRGRGRGARSATVAAGALGAYALLGDAF